MNEVIIFDDHHLSRIRARINDEQYKGPEFLEVTIAMLVITLSRAEILTIRRNDTSELGNLTKEFAKRIYEQQTQQRKILDGFSGSYISEISRFRDESGRNLSEERHWDGSSNGI